MLLIILLYEDPYVKCEHTVLLGTRTLLSPTQHVVQSIFLLAQIHSRQACF